MPRRRTTLAGCLAVAFGLGIADPAQATTTYVNTCADIGTHPKGLIALRYAAINAGEGDVIDLSTLTCSVITMNSANIPVSVNNLTIQSSAANPITIDASHASRVFNHTGTGTLEFRYVTIQNGNGNYGPEGNDNNYGGCIRSSGEIYLDHVTVQGCTARIGGGINSVGPTILTSSIVTGNSVSDLGYMALGGGIDAGGATTVANSTVSNNQSQSFAGGIRSAGKLTISHSTISGNTGPSCAIDAMSGSLSALEVSYSTLEHNGSGPGAALCISKSLSSVQYSSIRYSTIYANGGAAAVFVLSSNGFTNHLAVYNSTISANAEDGISCSGCALTMVASTIAFNCNIGLAASAPASVLLANSILANNPSDLIIGAGASIASGSHFDLVVTGNVVPGDALRGNPRLAPLAFRGGPTRTHALSVGSPAINSGPTAIVAPVDQRGSGYARSVGVAVDIGAYERQADDDELFGSNFD